MKLGEAWLAHATLHCDFLKMRTLSWFCVLVIGVLGFGFVAGAATDSTKNPAIREFDVDTLAALGRAIYRHDQWAWVASDVLLARKRGEELMREGVSGWIVDERSPDEAVVRFLRTKNGEAEAAYDVVFALGKAPTFVPAISPALTDAQKRRARALKTVEKEFAAESRPWCGGRPNAVILSDPTGDGFLVYFLRPKQTTESVPVGGHYRFTVSADGTRVTQIDRLFVSCLTLNRNEVPAGGKIAGLAMTQLVGERPLETTVFLSLQEKLPFAVSTRDGKIWSVSGGKIEPLQ